MVGATDVVEVHARRSDRRSPDGTVSGRLARDLRRLPWLRVPSEPGAHAVEPALGRLHAGAQPHVFEAEARAAGAPFELRGLGIFPATSVIADEVQRQYQVQPVGRADEIRERFYAVSIERKLKHPAVVAISQEARRKLFG